MVGTQIYTRRKEVGQSRYPTVTGCFPDSLYALVRLGRDSRRTGLLLSDLSLCSLGSMKTAILGAYTSSFCGDQDSSSLLFWMRQVFSQRQAGSLCFCSCSFLPKSSLPSIAKICGWANREGYPGTFCSNMSDLCFLLQRPLFINNFSTSVKAQTGPCDLGMSLWLIRSLQPTIIALRCGTRMKQRSALSLKSK